MTALNWLYFVTSLSSNIIFSHQVLSEFIYLNSELISIEKHYLLAEMFKHLVNNVNRKIEHEVEKQTHEEEMKALKAYLLGHGHDRVHPQILLGINLFI